MSHLLSQREAARVWGVSRATIQRAIATGTLSLTTDKLIDPAELLRAFGPARSRPGEPLVPPAEPPGPDPAQVARMAALEATLAARDREVALLSANLDDLRAQLRLLTHDAAPRKRRWWQFGG